MRLTFGRVCFCQIIGIVPRLIAEVGGRYNRVFILSAAVDSGGEACVYRQGGYRVKIIHGDGYYILITLCRGSRTAGGFYNFFNRYIIGFRRRGGLRLKRDRNAKGGGTADCQPIGYRTADICA